MSTLTIETYPNMHFVTSPFFPVAKVNIHRTVRSYLAKGEELTREKALSIFQDMKWRSNVKATLLNPVVLFLGGPLLAMPYLCINAVGVLNIAFHVLFVIGAMSFGTGIDQLLTNRAWEKAYLYQSKKLNAYITTLRKNPDMKVKLATLRTAS